MPAWTSCQGEVADHPYLAAVLLCVYVCLSGRAVPICRMLRCLCAWMRVHECVSVPRSVALRVCGTATCFPVSGVPCSPCGVPCRSPWHADGPRPAATGSPFPSPAGAGGAVGLHYLKFGYFFTDLTHRDGGSLQVLLHRSTHTACSTQPPHTTCARIVLCASKSSNANAAGTLSHGCTRALLTHTHTHF
jgi:hypothetical protein